MAASLLSGIKVLDLSQHIAGPYCAKLLAEFGARVIKVEPPLAGDHSRHLRPFKGDLPGVERSGLFLYLNDSKESITLNVEPQEGRDILHQLIADADVLIESFKPGYMDSLGVGYSALEKEFPSLIMLSVTPFGQRGPYVNYQATHIVHQAMGGWMVKLGEPPREPVQAGANLGYFITGAAAMSATMAAIFYRSYQGVGQHIDVSEWEATLGTAPEGFLAYEFTGRMNKRTYNWFPGSFQTKDGKWFGVNLLTQQQWGFLCEWMDMMDALESPRYQNGQQRREHGHELLPRIDAYIKARTRDELFAEGMERRIPVGMVYSAGEMLESPQYGERGYFVEVRHPEMGTVKMPGAPFILPESPWRLKNPPPKLGQHNKKVYGKLGLTDKDLVLLREQGVI